MNEKGLMDRVAKLFDDIYSFVSSHMDTREATRLRLSEAMKGRMRGREALPERDVEEFLRVRIAQALPRTAMSRAHEISEQVEEAFGAWLDLVREIGAMLEKAGLNWKTVYEAAELFLKGPEAIRDFAEKNKSKFSDYLIAASIAKATSSFNIYSIPMCLKAVFPYVKPERAKEYLSEARRAFYLIALARLKEMYDKGEWDELMLRRLSFLGRLIT
mgnify:CR=1 FL=1